MKTTHTPQQDPAWSILTGAAHGFGQALALELARERKRLLLSDIDLDALEKTAELARQAGAIEVKTRRVDVTRPEDWLALEQETRKAPIELLINNAGVCSAGTFEGLSLADWQWTLDIDLNGVIYGCYHFLPRLKAQASGRIINIASAAGLLSPPNLAAYNVAKAGVVALSESLAAELAGTGVGVTVVCPTFFQTGIADRGRVANADMKFLADRFLRGGPSAAVVARRTLQLARRGKLYALPMWDGWLGWVLKRLIPGQFPLLLAYATRLTEQYHLKGRT